MKIKNYKLIECTLDEYNLIKSLAMNHCLKEAIDLHNKSHLIGGFLLQKIDPLILQNLITNFEKYYKFKKAIF